MPSSLSPLLPKLRKEQPTTLQPLFPPPTKEHTLQFPFFCPSELIIFILSHVNYASITISGYQIYLLNFVIRKVLRVICFTTYTPKSIKFPCTSLTITVHNQSKVVFNSLTLCKLSPVGKNIEIKIGIALPINCLQQSVSAK